MGKRSKRKKQRMEEERQREVEQAFLRAAARTFSAICLAQKGVDDTHALAPSDEKQEVMDEIMEHVAEARSLMSDLLPERYVEAHRQMEVTT